MDEVLHLFGWLELDSGNLYPMGVGDGDTVSRWLNANQGEKRTTVGTTAIACATPLNSPLMSGGE